MEATSSNMFDVLRGVQGRPFERRLHRLNVHPSMVPKLGEVAELQGHRGCVNRIAWNERGTLLVSGSDDTHIGVWEYPSGRRRELFHTQHTANIFGVRFLGADAIVSGAMDSQVQLHLEPYDASRCTIYECHSGRVKDVEVEPGGAGNIWWSASEDGTVRQFDRRLPHAGCSTSRGVNSARSAADRGTGADAASSSKNVLVLAGAARSGQARPQQPARAMGVAVSPTDPLQLAVACGDNVVRLFDRRRLSLTSASRSARPAFTPCVAAFAPPHAYVGRGSSLSHLHATHVSFSPDGGSLLASFHADHVYLFDVRSAWGGGDAVPPVTAYMLPEPPVSAAVTTAAGTEGASAGGSDGGAAAATTSSRRAYSALAAEHSRAPETAGSADPTESIHRLSDAIARTHTLLAAPPQTPAWWQQKGGDGDGGSAAEVPWPPLSPEALAGLYSSRAEVLTQRAWRGDCYMALLDCARAHGLCPDSSATALSLVKALGRAGRRRACAVEARRFAAKFPECASLVPEYLPPSERGSGGGGGGGAGGGSSADAGGAGRSGSASGVRVIEGPRMVIRVGGGSAPLLEARLAAPIVADAEEDGYGGGDRGDDDTSGGGGQGGGGGDRRDSEDGLLEEQQAVAAAWRVLLEGGAAAVPGGGDTSAAGGEGCDDEAAAKRARYSGGGGGSADGGDGGSARRHMFVQCFAGARNVATDIKEAAFLGAHHIVAGSDDGRVFVWDRADGRLVAALAADEDVVNCVRPHPFDPVLATSGIENVVRLWAPCGGAGDGGASEAAQRARDGARSRSGSVATAEHASLAAMARDNQSAAELTPWALMNRALLRQIMVQMAANGGDAGDGGGAGDQDGEEEDGSQMECIQS